MQLKDMTINDLTVEDLEQIYIIYAEVCGVEHKTPIDYIGRTARLVWEPGQEHLVKEQGLQSILKEAQEQKYFERRIGSKWEFDSKFRIQETGQGLSITFVPNFDINEQSVARYDEAISAKNAFELRVKEYFNNLPSSN